MDLLMLSGDDLRAALPMLEAVEVSKAAFAAQAEGRCVSPQRLGLPVEPAGGTTLVMPAHLPGTGLATKIVSVFPGNESKGLPTVTGLVVALDEDTGQPLAVLDGTFLTAWRTGAAGGAGVDLLARSDAVTGALLGSGVQAGTQLLAMCAVRRLERVRIWSRSPDHAASFAECWAAQVDATLEVVERVEDAVDGADIVMAATSACEPLFEASLLAEGAHLGSVGSFRPQMIEVDPALAARARIFVDDRDAALAEAGELIAAIERGITTPDEWTLLGDVARGVAEGRATPEDRTWFKSVGLAVQDVSAASAAISAARQAGLGQVVRF
jgi:ornithine cyclodeaminase